MITPSKLAEITATDLELSGTGFPRVFRLLRPGDYASVFKNNVRVSDRYWTILAANSGQQHARLGLAIAKKRAKRAVDRNRIKRTAREYFRQHRTEISAVDLVIMNRDAATTASNQELRQSLDLLWVKLRHKCKFEGS